MKLSLFHLIPVFSVAAVVWISALAPAVSPSAMDVTFSSLGGALEKLEAAAGLGSHMDERHQQAPNEGLNERAAMSAGTLKGGLAYLERQVRLQQRTSTLLTVAEVIILAIPLLCFLALRSYAKQVAQLLAASRNEAGAVGKE